MIDYKIMYDGGSGSGTYTTLATGVTSLTYTATGLTAGTTYAFKVYSRNSDGFSFGSSSVSILAAQVPDTPSAPTTTIEGNFVKIAWTAPFAEGSPITAYLITLRQSDSTTFSLELSNCDGSSTANMQ